MQDDIRGGDDKTGSTPGQRFVDAYIAANTPEHIFTDSVPVDQYGNPILRPGTGSAAAGPQDWSAYLGLFGLPADVLREINAIFTKTPDINQATVIAQAYVRGTPWYAQTYPGIQEAIAKGVVRDERDYRANMNAFNQVYQQYAQRDITGNEYAQHLREGVSSSTIGQRFQGAAISDAYTDDWQYLAGNFADEGEGRLSDAERGAYGQQQAGLTTPLGLKVQRRLQMANERVAKVFSGQLATGQLAMLNQPGERSDIGR